MNANATVTQRLNTLLWKFATARSWVDKQNLARHARRFTDALSALATIDDWSTDETPAEPVQGTLRVLSGLHQDAVFELSEGDYILGSATECDIVLLDEGIAERHCRITFGRRGFDLQDLRGSEPQSIAPLPATHDYQIGGAIVSLTRNVPNKADDESDHEPARSREPVITSWPVVITVVVGLALSISAVVGWQRTVPLSPEQAAERLQSATSAAVSAGFDSVRFRTSQAGEMEVTGFVTDIAQETRLRQWVAKESDIEARVSVRPSAQLIEDVRHSLHDESLRVALHGGRLYIDGETHQPSVKGRIQTLREELRGLVEIDDRVIYAPGVLAPGPLPVRLRSVMLDEPKYFVTDSGARYFVGGVLPDGAEVVAILGEGIRFRKDGKIVLYRLE